MMMSQGILLESGTNELEVVCFKVAGHIYAVNVSKVQEIIKKIPYTKIPNSHEFVKGMINPRGKIMPLLDLNKILNGASVDNEKALYINLSFNAQLVSIEVDQVLGIRKISWQEIEKIDVEQSKNMATGVIKLQDEMIVLLDFESIFSGIMGQREERINVKEERKNISILFAEDSNVMSMALKDGLLKAGYENITVTHDGAEAWDIIQNHTFDLVISDVEMPKMDGYTLTKKIKQMDKSIPVVLFSSLITEETMHKGESVGANLQVNKPSIQYLIEKLDEFLGF
jgi:two-component system chemotaxis response regulator CheV